MFSPPAPSRHPFRRLAVVLLFCLACSFVVFVTGLFSSFSSVRLAGDRKSRVSDADVARMETYWGGSSGSSYAAPPSTGSGNSTGDAAGGDESADSVWVQSISAADLMPNFQRLIIKNALLDLKTEDTDQALEGVFQIAADSDGYIISQRAWTDGETRFATLTLAAPVQDFENVLRRLRGLATQVLKEEVSGQDVTEDYVDLEARLRNLEATRDRVRGFLDQAHSVEAALKVNRELSALEDEIERAQGRLSYLRDRAALSTITVNLTPVLPAPVLAGWRPFETAQQAVQTLAGIGRALVDALLWVAIVPGPFLALVLLLDWGLRGAIRRLGRRLLISRRG